MADGELNVDSLITRLLEGERRAEPSRPAQLLSAGRGRCGGTRRGWERGALPAPGGAAARL